LAQFTDIILERPNRINVMAGSDQMKRELLTPMYGQAALNGVRCAELDSLVV
jgi:hypothetical protein